MLPSRSNAPKRMPWDLAPSASAKWSKYGAKSHQPCDECVQRRHHGDTTKSPDPARQVRTVGEQKSFLCTTHGQARREADDDAKAQAKFAASLGRSR